MRQSALIADAGDGLAFRVREPMPASPTALLLLLHGVGGDETNLAALAEGVDAGTLVVFARGPLQLAPGQHAWFRVAFTDDGPRIEAREAEHSRRRLVEFIERLQARHGIDPRRTLVAGFSQGGILSASVGLSAPERVRGFAVLGGRILPELEPVLASPERLAHLDALIAHGRDDEKLPVAWAERADAWLKTLGVPHALRLYPGGHGIPPAMARDFSEWQRVLLAPLRLVLGDDDCLLLGAAPVVVAPGIPTLLRDHFSPRTPLAMALENAIADIEDVLAKVPRALHGSAVASRDPALRAIADAAGLASDAGAITREAVERLFARLSAVAMGRPPASEGLPDDPRFAARVLVVRELMHHLDIASITLSDAA